MDLQKHTKNANTSEKEVSIGVPDDKEEIANAITHGIGAGLAVAALVILIVMASLNGHALHIISFAIFGTTLVLLYLMSTLYHALRRPNVKLLFRKFDHMAIFLLIAGTYTPFCFVVLQGWIGWTLLIIVWGCAIAGIILKAFYTGKQELFSTICYIVMGWACTAAIKPLYSSMSATAFIFLMLGGAMYTGGTFFFVRDHIRYNHSIWHLFVLAGSIFHFFSVMCLLN